MPVFAMDLGLDICPKNVSIQQIREVCLIPLLVLNVFILLHLLSSLLPIEKNGLPATFSFSASVPCVQGSMTELSYY